MEECCGNLYLGFRSFTEVTYDMLKMERWLFIASFKTFQETTELNKSYLNISYFNLSKYLQEVE